MTEAATAAGWYGDPQNPARLRYHDGADWTEHTRVRRGSALAAAYGSAATDPAAAQHVEELLAPPEAAPTVRLDGYRARERAMRTANPFAYAGATIAIVGLLFNPFGITSAVALLFSLVGLPVGYLQAKHGLRYNGRLAAAIGILVATAGIGVLLLRSALGPAAGVGFGLPA